MTHAMQNEGILRRGPNVIEWVVKRRVFFWTVRGAQFDPTSNAGLRWQACDLRHLARLCRDYESVRPFIGERQFLKDLADVLRAIIPPGWWSHQLDWMTGAEPPDHMLADIIVNMADRLQKGADEFDRQAAWRLA